MNTTVHQSTTPPQHATTEPRPTIIPPTPPHEHTHTIIFLHGRGDKAANFSHSLNFSRTSQDQTLFDVFPSVRWVFPAATPLACSAHNFQRVSQWFDVYDVRNFKNREGLQAEGLRASVDRIREVVRQEVELLGGRSERVVLAGISQGGAVAVHTLLNLNLDFVTQLDLSAESRSRSEKRLGAFLGFSCRMPFSGRTLAETREVLGLDGVPNGNEVLAGTPVFLEHCVDDPLVLIQHGGALYGTLQGFGCRFTFKEYPDGGHWFNSPAGVDDAVQFLRENVIKPNLQDCQTSIAELRLASANAMDLS